MDLNKVVAPVAALFMKLIAFVNRLENNGAQLFIASKAGTDENLPLSNDKREELKNRR